MRLLKTDTLEVVEFVGRVPPYVILSHRWGPDEVTFQDLSQLSRTALQKKKGYAKISGCCARAIEDGYRYAWVDTCCIDKTSSAELSEAINSMYRWYQEAHICYAYMDDVTLDAQQNLPPSDTSSAASGHSIPKREVGRPNTPSMTGKPLFHSIPSILRDYDKLPRTFENSRWFTRGWTLQELIAPPLVEFYAHDWQEIGTKYSLRNVIAKVTGIDIRVLEGADPTTCHVAERMSWAANRQTTRVEDAAYCLLGIFKVHMPLIYGEGHRAFYRLQKEIMKTTEDYTMLAWGLSKFLSNKHHWKGVKSGLEDPRRPLADGPGDFEEHNRNLWTYARLIPDLSTAVGVTNSSTINMEDTPPLITSRGLRVTLLIRPTKAKSNGPASGEVHAYINCKTSRPGSSPGSPLSPVCLVIRRQASSSQTASNVYTGSSDPNAAFVLLDSVRDLASFRRETIYLSTATLDSDIKNHRDHSLAKNLYILDKPPPLRPGDGLIAGKTTWKITSCFSHAVGAGAGHTIYEVPRKFTSATLFHPFDLPASTVRLFGFEVSPAPVGGQINCDSTFGIVIGNGWCDIVPLADPEFKEQWGTLVRDGYWNEPASLRFISHVAVHGAVGQYGLTNLGESGRTQTPADRVVRRIGFGGLEVSVKLKKVRRDDINCESAMRILWTANWES
ncbi:heterokaryon incompatibility protein-domain-containing protein [Podospora australis]|uniref:Heterokaryon incompatibility protein-domain-containing protein n=1 Tax=Podospora australis TaxID=1536484 RepID=A0AAN7AE60_9PEZI|nr:heterokaryon incompatibility protein-domain-containing protein [Podospora australis]